MLELRLIYVTRLDFEFVLIDSMENITKDCLTLQLLIIIN